MWQLSLLLLATVTVAELVLTFVEPRVGLLFHSAILFALLYAVLQSEGGVEQRFLIAFLLVPLIRVLSLGLPLAAWPQLSWYFAVSVPLFIAMMLIIRLERWSRRELGHTLRKLPLQVGIGAAGLGLGWMEYQILEPTPLAAELTWQAVWLPAMILLVSTGYLEELLFRGLLQSAAVPIVGERRGVFFVAAVFAVLHIGYQSALDVIFVFVVGLIFGIVVARSHSLLGVTLAHGLTNISLFLVWPLLLG